MINYIDGDLVRDAEQYDVILHGCNCQNNMGAGIALQIKNKFPEAYVVDCKTKKGDKTKLGTITFTTETKPIVVNCYTQYNYGAYKTGGRDFDYMAAKSALQMVRKQFGGKKIGMPMIGAMLGGGDWSITKRIIEEVLGDEDVTIVNYKT
jgi:O-acetyl-ADP-ribose deacetylase (regulator of RNase III)